MTVQFLDRIGLLNGSVTQVHFSQLPGDVAYTDVNNVFSVGPQVMPAINFSDPTTGAPAGSLSALDDGAGNWFLQFADNAQLISGVWNRFDVTKYVVLFQVQSSAGAGVFNVYTAAPAANPVGNFQLYFRVDGQAQTLTLNGQSQLAPYTTSQTPLTVFGASGQTATLMQFHETTDVQDRPMADVDAVWANSSDASRKGRLVLRAWDTAAREGIRVESSGTVPLLGFYGVAAVAQGTPAGVTSGYTDSGTTVVHTAGTFTGAGGGAAYTIGDIVTALKKLGLIGS